MGIVALVFSAQGHDRSGWPAWSYALLGMLVLVGALLLAIGLFGSRKDAEAWADYSSRHEAAILVMILAAPLYFLLKLIEGSGSRSR
jgi:hypothetical protein